MSSIDLRGFSRTAAFARACFVSTILCAAANADVSELPTPYGPSWSQATPKKVLAIEFDPTQSADQNGELLRKKLLTLVPGDRLEIGAGTWSVKKLFIVSLKGTQSDPIWIVAKRGTRPVITRPDPFQNVMNVGTLSSGPTEFVAFRGLEITGGSIGLRLDACSNVWIDQCVIHDTDQAGLVANTQDTSFLHITRNEIHHTAGTGEGMYLGGNNASAVMSQSIVAQNYVHHTSGSQGDGIEVKQGSWGNLIAENLVHDTKYPCLIAYGTGGNPPNVIERNVLYRAVDNVLQVQGEAIVRNNLIMSGLNGFHSHDHQGQTRDLVFVHNTIVNEKRGANLTSWTNRPGMVFANNAVYSNSSQAVVFGGGGAAGVTVAGNVRFGSVLGGGAGFVPGTGLADFVNVDWTGGKHQAQPSPASPLRGAAALAFALPFDLNARERLDPDVAGALDYLSFGLHYGQGVAGFGGKTPLVAVDSPRDIGNASLSIEVSRARPLSTAILLLGLGPSSMSLGGGQFLNGADLLRLERTDAFGFAAHTVPVPNDPALAGEAFYAQWIVEDAAAPGGIAFTDGLRLVIETP